MPEAEDNMSKQAITSRPFETENDFQQMQALLMEARAQTDDWHYAHVGDLQFLFFMVACHLKPQEHIRLWHAGDQLVGYAILSEDPSYDWQILPAYEWQGIETEALSWAETRLAELRQRDAGRWGGQVVSTSRPCNPQRTAFLEQHGFRLGGQFPEVNLLRRLNDPIPTVTIPAGFQVRAMAEAGELESRVATERAVWLPWPVGDIHVEDYDDFMRMPGYERELDIVAVAPDGTIASYANGWLDARNRIGDVGPVGAHPAYRRQGLTRAVMLECMRRMQARGMTRVILSTGVSNTPALQLYESVGFKIMTQTPEYIKPA
jgi:ribosomal protein S18 acetylase RimI-like enzyme